MAYKVIIADNDEQIRKLINQYIDWKKIGVYLVEEAINSQDTFRLAEDICPDIVIIDSSMLIETNYVIIDNLMNINSSMLIIILSGYDGFEIVQRALTMRVFDYILKPIKRSVLIDVLDRAIEKIE